MLQLTRLVSLLLLPCSLLVAADPVVSWTVDLGEPVAGARPLWSGDAAEGVAVTLNSGRIVLLDARGVQRAEFKLDARAGAPAMAVNFWGPDHPALAAVDEWGSVYAFNARGERIWKYARNTKVGDFRMPVAADVDGSGRSALVMEDWLGHVYAVNHEGKLLLEVSGARASPPAIADVNGDGKPEIIVSFEDGHVACFTADGTVLWIRNYPGKFGRSTPVIADADRDGRLEVYLQTPATPMGLYALDAATGRKLWFAPSRMQAYQSLAVADVDGDGKDEILFGDKNTRLYCVDAKGRPKWDRQVDGRGIFFSPAIVRTAAGVRIFQIARGVGLNGKTLYELGPDGAVRSESPLAGGGAGAPLLFRFRGDTSPSMLVVPAGNQVICYRFSGDTRIAWPGMKNDLQSGGARRSVTARSGSESEAGKPRSAVLGSNLIELAAGTTGPVMVRVRQPDAAVRLTLVPAESRRAAIETTSAGAYDVRILSAEGASTGHWVYTLDSGLSADRALLSACHARLTELRRHPKARKEIIDYLDTTAGAMFEQALRSHSPATFADARAFFAYAQALAAALDRTTPTGDLLIRPIGNPWVDFDATAYLNALGSEAVLKVSMLGNEYESAAVAVSNLQPRTVTVRLLADKFGSVEARRVVEFREVPQVLTETGATTEDVLPLLGEGQTIRLGPGETRKIWLVFHSRDLSSGVSTSKISAADLLSPGPPSELAVSLNVRTLRLPDGFVYRHCSWFYPASLPEGELREAALRDTVSHGMNVFLIPAATVTVDRQGNITGADAKLGDQLLADIRPRVPKGKVTFLINGSVGIRWPEGFKATPDLADRALGNGLHWYVAHMRSLGLESSDYALYVKDEPALMGKDADFDRWVAEVQQIKRLEPHVWLYANPTGGADAEMLQPVADLIDIWAPGLGLLTDPDHGPALDALFRRGKAYWHYEVPGDSRTLDAEGFYRGKPWLAWKLGMTGGGFWVYSDSPFWGRYLRNTEYGTIYPTDRGPVTTRRWEASRDGSEDFELLTMVRQRALARPDSAESKRALALIDEAVAYVTAGPDLTQDGHRAGMKAPDYAKWQEYKERLAEAAERLAP